MTGSVTFFGWESKEAQQAGRPAEALIEEWLTRRFPPPAPIDERERAREVLRAAGLLAEPTAEMLAIAAQRISPHVAEEPRQQQRVVEGGVGGPLRPLR